MFLKVLNSGSAQQHYTHTHSLSLSLSFSLSLSHTATHTHTRVPVLSLSMCMSIDRDRIGTDSADDRPGRRSPPHLTVRWRLERTRNIKMPAPGITTLIAVAEDRGALSDLFDISYLRSVDRSRFHLRAIIRGYAPCRLTQAPRLTADRRVA